MKRWLLPVAGLGLFFLCRGLGPSPATGAQFSGEPGYVGSAACGSCHQEEYRVFQSTSKKAVTRRQVEKLLPKLSGEEQTTCFRCHATGYGKAGGFVSYAQTPELGDVGCEACHGPGSAHVALQGRDPSENIAVEGVEGDLPPAGLPSSPLIARRPAPEVCAECHTQARGGVPPKYAGAH